MRGRIGITGLRDELKDCMTILNFVAGCKIELDVWFRGMVNWVVFVVLPSIFSIILHYRGFL
jgi:hypothetical protein